MADEQRRIRRYKERINFDLVGFAFTERYRFSTLQVEELLFDLGTHLQPEKTGGHNIDPRQKLLIALRYYASGDFCYTIEDTHGV